MKKCIIYLLGCLFILINQPLKAQNIYKAKMVLDSVMNKYVETLNYSFKYQYTIKGVSSDAVIEKKSAFNIKEKDKYYQKIGNIEFVLTKEIYLMLDHDTRKIQYRLEPNVNIYDLEHYDVLTTLNYFKNIGHDAYTEDEQYHILKLESNSGISIPFSYVEMYVDKKTFTIYKQNIIYNTIIKNSKGNFDYPLMELLFSEFKKDLNSKERDKFRKSRYLKDQLGKVIPAAKYKNYTIEKL